MINQTNNIPAVTAWSLNFLEAIPAVKEVMYDFFIYSDTVIYYNTVKDKIITKYLT